MIIWAYIVSTCFFPTTAMHNLEAPLLVCKVGNSDAGQETPIFFSPPSNLWQIFAR